MNRNIKNKLVAYGLTLASVISLNGCARKINCNIEENHVHLYKSDNGIVKYDSSELDVLPSNYYRTDITLNVTPYERSYFNYLSDNGFIHIETNYDLLKKYFPKLPDYTEYEYSYEELTNSKEIRDENGDIVEVINKYGIKYDWIKIPKDENLTGKERTITYAYRGYKIYFDERQKKFYYELSGYYDTLDDLIKDGYTHIKINTFVRQVDKNDVISLSDEITLTK